MRARGGERKSGLVLGILVLGATFVGAQRADARENPPPQDAPTAAPSSATAAPDRTAQVYTIPRATSPIRVDGVLDEESWKQALRLELPYEVQPGENTPAPVKTEVLLTYDATALHAAFRAYDPDPAAIRAHLTDRDQAYRDDWVGLYLDTFNDERRGVQMFVNPLGVQMDGSRNDVGNGGEQSEDMSWDAIWLSAGRITSEGYEVEMSIPFTSLRFSRDEQTLTWGLMVMRSYPRNQRHQIGLRPIDRNKDCFFCQEAKLTGLDGLSPGRNLEFDPTLTAHRGAGRREEAGAPLVEHPLAGDGGVSARWSMTPNLTLNSAFNPDFSQVEADTAQLGVNQRFALFYPEKRPFFMEAADFFTTPLNVIYTRTVLEPEWGVKMSGKEGPHALGAAFGHDEKTWLIFPSNQDSDDTTLPQGNDVDVLRYRHDVGKNSTLGMMLTDRRGEDYRNRLYGLDGHIRLSAADTLRFQALHSDTRYPDQVAADFAQPRGQFGDEALTLRYMHATRDWFWYGTWEDLGKDFRADTGFIPRVDTRRVEGGAERAFWGKPDSWYTRLIFGFQGSRVEDHEGVLTDSDAGPYFLMFGPRQSFLFAKVGAQKEFFDGTTYDRTAGEFFFNIRPTGAFTMSLAGRAGGAVDYDNSRPARLARLSPGFTLDLGRHFHAQVDDTLERLSETEGRLYFAHLTQLRLVYQFNVRNFARAIVQNTTVHRNTDLYDPILNPDGVLANEREILTQLLYSYKINPQTLVYLGYSDTRTTEDFIDLTQKDRTVFVKFGYAWVR